MDQEQLMELIDKAADIAREIGEDILPDSTLVNWPLFDGGPPPWDDMNKLFGAVFMIYHLCDRDEETIRTLCEKAVECCPCNRGGE